MLLLEEDEVRRFGKMISRIFITWIPKSRFQSPCVDLMVLRVVTESMYANSVAYVRVKEVESEYFWSLNDLVMRGKNLKVMVRHSVEVCARGLKVNADKSKVMGRRDWSVRSV